MAALVSAALAGLLALAGPISAQEIGSRSLGPITAVSTEWLQATGGALHRDAWPSMVLGLAHDFATGLRVEVGYLRAVRSRTTAEGATAGISLPFTFGRLSLRPGVAALVGAAESSADHGGYQWEGVDADVGETGYQPWIRQESGTTVGGGLSVGAELALVAGISATASVRQWFFSGSVIRPDRASTLAGFGVSLRPAVLWHAVQSTGGAK